MLEMEMRREHADLIHAWAEGADIQIKNEFGDWVDIKSPSFKPYCEYRIKPTPKADVVNYYYKSFGGFERCHKIVCTNKHDLRCTFDGETGELKSSEVIK